MNHARLPLHALVASAALLVLGGCTDKLVGFRATFSSNTLAVGAEPASGERLRFRVPKRTTDAAKRTVYLQPHRAILHLPGYLPMTPDGTTDAGDAYEVQVTLPRDLVQLASGALPNTVRVQGELYLPGEVGVMSLTRTELREPTGAHVVHVGLEAVHTGPMTRLAQRIGDFLRGLYAAR
jgi:hypothetical protein